MCVYAVRLLAAVTGEGHADVLVRWNPAPIKEAVAFTLNIPEVQQPGCERTKRDIKAVRGRADTALLLREKGPAALLASLDTSLPSLISPGTQTGSSCG